MRPLHIVGGILLVGVLASAFIISFQDEATSVFAVDRPYVEIAEAAGYVNNEPFQLADFVGKKVILVDFMTYSCINCQRTFPYVVSWYEKYKDSGLQVVGIHTPEFAFEKDRENVERAMEQAGITWPVVLDNDYGTWRAYGNRYWPRKYLIDIHGNIVYDHIGEGNYEETEMKIRELLRERADLLGEQISLGDTVASTANADALNRSRSPETYFGSHRNVNFASGRPGQIGDSTFESPSMPVANRLYLVGSWSIQPEYAESRDSGKIVYRYRGKEVYVVATSESGVRVRVLQDGVPVSAARGDDVDTDGYFVLQQDRLYKVIKNAEFEEHVLELEVPAGVRVFSFTFG